MLDVLIQGGTLVDGSGEPARSGDVGIRDGKIVAIGSIDEDARETIDFVHDQWLPIHLDGARLFNAATATGVPAKTLLAQVNSTSICLSKGLGCPLGSSAGAK